MYEAHNVKSLAMTDRYNREKHETQLHLYMQEKGLTDYAFAKLVGCNADAIKYWRFNLSLPSLPNAFKIERATRGAVPAVYWLDTPRGKAAMTGDTDE